MQTTPTLAELFRAQARRVPERTAVRSAGRSVSYGDLDAWSDNLAGVLRQKGVGPGDNVVICLDRSVELVVTLVAVQKLGAAYLPLQHDLPPRRREYIIRDAAPAVIVVQPHLQAGFEAYGEKLLVIAKELYESTLSPRDVPHPAIHATTPAYLLYTSGSTGEPKGVLNEQQAIVNRLVWMRDHYGIGERDVILQKTPYTFDVSVWELYLPLICGAVLVLARPGGHLELDYLADLIDREAVTVLHFVPSMLNAFVEEAGGSQFRSVRQVICSGEELTPALAAKFRRTFSEGARLANLYGPTEASIDVSYYDCPRDLRANAVPIGKAIWNTQLYILDRNLRPVSPGEPGGLYIGGTGLATGYVARRARTAEKFIPDAFGNVPGRRLYATGDIAREEPDGNIVFLGREDHQVKINGQRIELGEIETHLQRNPGVAAAIVVPQSLSGQSRQLVGYVVPRLENRQLHADTLIEGWARMFDDRAPARGEIEGEPDADAAMLEQTAARVLEARPRRVVEIGCGAGGLLTRLVSHVESYIGLDVSAGQLARLRMRIEHQPVCRNKVRLHELSGSDLPVVAKNGYDTVVLDCVTQYFPDTSYLDDVLRCAIERIEEGFIFVAGVRNRSLQQMCHAAAIEVSHSALAPDEKLELLRERLATESELTISPRYFYDLPTRFRRLSRVEVLPRTGGGSAEKFCYDAVLVVSGAQAAGPKVETRPFKSLREFSEIDWRSHAVLCFTNIPATSFEDDLRALAQVTGAPCIAETIRYSPADILREAQARDLCARIILSPADANGTFSVLLARSPTVLADCVLDAGAAGDIADANEPWRAQVARFLPRRLKADLSAELPAHMVPQVIVCIDQIPLNSSGKADRAKLPGPGQAAVAHVVPEPSSVVERELTAVWRKFLGIEAGADAGRNFFELGGDSILAMRIVAALRRKGYELSIGDLLQHPTPRQLAACIRTGASRRPGDADARNPKRDHAGILARRAANRLEHLQLSADDKKNLQAHIRRSPHPLEAVCKVPTFISKLIYDSLATGGGECNVELIDCDLGVLDTEALVEAWRRTLRRHEILRTHFCFSRDGSVFQLIYADATLDYTLLDWSGTAADGFSADFDRLLEEGWKRGVDLQSNCLMRLYLVRKPDGTTRMAWFLHHALTDGWSYHVMLQDVFRFYEEAERRPCEAFPGDALGELGPLQYRDFCNRLEAENRDACRRHWSSYLGGIPQDTWLTRALGKRGRTCRRSIVRIEKRVDAKALARLAAAAANLQSTVNAVLQVAWGILLSQRTGVTDVAYGSIASLRQFDLPGIERVVGPLFNLLLVRMKVGDSRSAAELVQMRMQELQVESDYIHVDVRDLFTVVKRSSGLPLYDATYVYENFPVDFPRSVSRLDNGTRSERPLILVIWPGDGLRIQFFYDAAIFAEKDVEMLMSDYVRLVSMLADSPDANVGALKKLLWQPAARTSVA